MITVEIDGVGDIELDDSFKDKSPEEQQNIIDDIKISVEASDHTYTDEGERMVDESLTDIRNNIDLTKGASMGTRAAMSVTGSSEQEAINIFKELYPKGDVIKIINKDPMGAANLPGAKYLKPMEKFLAFKENAKDESELWKPFDPYVPAGTDIAELGDWANVVPFIAGGWRTAITTKGKPVIERMLEQSKTAAITRLGMEGVEVATGVQEQTPGQVIEETGTEAALAGIAEPIASALPAFKNRLRYGADFDTSEAAYYLRQPRELETIHEGTELKPLPTYLQNLGKGPLKMIGRFGARSEHGEAQTVDMMHSSHRELISLRGADPTSIDEGVLDQGLKNYNKTMDNIRVKARKDTLTAGEDVEHAGKSFSEFAHDFVTKSRKEVGDLYDRVDKHGQNISIGIEDAKNIADEIDNGILAYKKGFDGDINVEDPNLGVLRGVVDDLRQMSGAQVDYNTIKTLRTRLFDLIDNDAWGWRYSNMQAKELWDALSDAMMKETNDQITQGVAGRDAKLFIDSLRKAGKAHSVRMETFSNKKIIKALRAKKGDLTPQLGEMFMQPHAHTESLYSLVKQYSPEKLKAIRGYVYNRILDKPNPLKALDDWKAKNPNSYGRAFPKKDESTIRQAAADISRLRSSEFKKMLDKNVEIGGKIFDLISQNRAPEARRLIDSFDNKDLAAKSVIDHMVKISTKLLRGKNVVEHGSFQKMLLNLETSDIGKNLFSKSAFKRLKNLDSYLEVLSQADSGVGIAEGAMGKNLLDFTNPGAIISAMRMFGMNSLVSRALVKDGVGDKIAKWLANRRIKTAKKEKIPYLPWSIAGQIIKEAVKSDIIPAEKIKPTHEIKEGEVIPKKDIPIGSLTPSDFEPVAQTPIYVTPPPQQMAPPQQTAQPQGQPTQTAMLPPSMRDPSSLLGQMAQQRQPMQMSDGGWVDSTDIGKEAKALGAYLPGDVRGGPGDALRHAYASALATQQHGEGIASLGGAFNELTESNFGLKPLFLTGRDQEVYDLSTQGDDKVNALGRRIGSETSTREEALARILDEMEASTGQDSYWAGDNLTPVKGGNRMDSGVSVPWNRQHYGESPADIRAKIQHMRTNTSGIMSKISVGKGNRP